MKYQFGGFSNDKRKKDTPEKAAMREMMQTYLKENNVDIKSGEDVNSIECFKEAFIE